MAAMLSVASAASGIQMYDGMESHADMFVLCAASNWHLGLVWPTKRTTDLLADTPSTAQLPV